jgi:hypothetical protein
MAILLSLLILLTIAILALRRGAVEEWRRLPKLCFVGTVRPADNPIVRSTKSESNIELLEKQKPD